MTLLGKQQLPAKDFKELLDYIKANKDKVSSPTPASARPRTFAACSS
jgi:tripartite-type tricarboxylate transporter receptor subunit TctC